MTLEKYTYDRSTVASGAPAHTDQQPESGQESIIGSRTHTLTHWFQILSIRPEVRWMLINSRSLFFISILDRA